MAHQTPNRSHFFLLPIVLLLFPALASADTAKPPNVLFIAVDDLRPELGCFGARAKTPNLDRLAQSSLVFDRAYCNQAVCGASRVSLMTGLYPEYTGERTYHVTDWRKRWADIITLNQHFTAHGYTTVGLGKIYHGSGGPGVDPDNWTEWVKVRGRQYGDPASLKNKRQRNNRSRGPSTEGADVPDDTHFDGSRAKVGAAKLRQLARTAKKEKGQPFFLAVGFTKPHLPFVAPKKYWDLYDRASFQLPPNLGVPPGYPNYARNRNAGEIRAYNDIPLKTPPADWPQELNQRLLHGYHACVSYMDRNVGVLLDALEQSGVAENTIVVFWADHGWKLGDHSSWCKHTNFECDTRVPLLIRDTRIPAAQGRSSALVELIDLYPTLCDLCGLATPAHVQGRSLRSVLEEPSTPHREFAYSSYPHNRGGAGGAVVGHSIRTQNHRYTEWWAKRDDQVVASVLTDLKADPGEVTAVKGAAELRQQLSRQLQAIVLEMRKQ